ncbi:MAG: hypothetical protein H0T91_11015, partial [Propionibacteriaceae bacterium]|nr:hypothetical protein [Propionibacteriaceae bacterium]
PDGVRESSADPSFVPIAISARAAPREVTLTTRIVDQPEAATLVVGALEPDVSMVTISGPTSAIDRVVKVELPVEIGDHRTDFRESFVPVALDADGAQIPEVEIQPDQVSTDVSVTLRGHQVAVFVDVTGQPASGYQVVEQRTIPLSIVVDGPDEVLDSIVYVYTQPVDITNATEDVSTTVAIDQESLPEGVRILTPTSGEVQVIVQISQQASPQTLPGQTVQVTGLDPGFDASSEPAEIDVIVETSTQQITRLQPGDIVVSVSASGLGPGTYRLRPSVSVPPEMSWIRTDPELVTVSIVESNAFNGDAVPGLGGSGPSADDDVSPEASPIQSPTT